MKKYLFLIVVTPLLLAGCRSSILQDPTTMISYTVPQTSHVTLTVENSYNTVVMTPVDTIQQAGNYMVALSMSSFQEGVYFYTLQCNGVGNSYYSKVTQPMLLLK